jgi:hypothetical protein
VEKYHRCHDRRFMVSSGVIARTSRMLPLTQRNNVTFKRPLLGRPLRFGTLSAESAGPRYGLETVEYVPEEGPPPPPPPVPACLTARLLSPSPPPLLG